MATRGGGTGRGPARRKTRGATCNGVQAKPATSVASRHQRAGTPRPKKRWKRKPGRGVQRGWVLAALGVESKGSSAAAIGRSTNRLGERFARAAITHWSQLDGIRRGGRLEPMDKPQAQAAVGQGDEARANGQGRPGVVILALAELPERAILDEQALADALGITKRTVRRMVSRHELPPSVPFAGRAMWQVRRVLAWFESRAERAARDAERTVRRLDGTR